MPSLEKITISDFRNIEFQELEFSPNVNCIRGNNGVGKTNLLDAIHYLSMTKSAFSLSDRYNFRYGRDTFALCGVYRMENGLENRFSIQVSPEGKRMRRDDKAYQRIADHIGILPVVMVSPSDTALVSESGDERRRFVNSVLSQMDREYLNAAQQYNRLLMQRNRMLKESGFDQELMKVLDARLSSCAEPIFKARKAFTERLAPVVSNFYRTISGNGEEVSIDYVSDLADAPLEEILASRLEKDMTFRYTTAGIQRDDFVFCMNGYPIRRCGSQGQQKSFLVALKFAQYEIMKQEYGFAPMLLLDDVFDKLDTERMSNLLGMVSSNDFGQIFLTDCSKERLQGIIDGFTADRAYFDSEAGTFTRQR